MAVYLAGESRDSLSLTHHNDTSTHPASATLRDPMVLASAAARLLARRNGDPVLDPVRSAVARGLIRRAVIAELARSFEDRSRSQ